MSQGTKETIATHLGFKSGSAGACKGQVGAGEGPEGERHIKLPDPDKSKLLEVVVSLQVQLEQRRQYGEQRDRSFQNLTEETENLKNRLAAVSSAARPWRDRPCSPEKKDTPPVQFVSKHEFASFQGTVPSGDLAAVQDQLRDGPPVLRQQTWLCAVPLVMGFVGLGLSLMLLKWIVVGSVQDYVPTDLVDPKSSMGQDPIFLSKPSTAPRGGSADVYSAGTSLLSEKTPRPRPPEVQIKKG
ncbi:hypothetical protein NHX12_024681, partial [Muraenolepis orangiensis]